MAEDLKTAQKAKDEATVGALRVVRAEIMNAAIAKNKKELTDEEALQVARSLVKRLREAQIDFQKGGREDLVAKNAREIDLLSKYLPPELSIEDVQSAVKEIVVSGSYTQKDFGKAMREVMAKFKGQADGSLVSRILKELLPK